MLRGKYVLQEPEASGKIILARESGKSKLKARTRSKKLMLYCITGVFDCQWRAGKLRPLRKFVEERVSQNLGCCAVARTDHTFYENRE